jgi:hypothetical protein
MQLSAVPLWVLWTMAAVGIGLVAVAVTAILSPEKRGWSGRSLACATALFVARVLVSHNPRHVLWFAFALASSRGSRFSPSWCRTAVVRIGRWATWNRGIEASSLRRSSAVYPQQLSRARFSGFTKKLSCIF